MSVRFVHTISEIQKLKIAKFAANLMFFFDIIIFYRIFIHYFDITLYIFTNGAFLKYKFIKSLIFRLFFLLEVTKFLALF